jgi:hypothetical protein
VRTFFWAGSYEGKRYIGWRERGREKRGRRLGWEMAE